MLNRGAAKEGTDLLDIVRLCLDPLAGPVLRDQLARADPQLRADAARHAQRWGIPEGRSTELDDLHLTGELLEAVLSEP